VIRLSSRFWLFLLVVLAVVAAYNSVVFVDETEFVVVTRFGEIVAVYDQVGDEVEPTVPGENSSSMPGETRSGGFFHDRGLMFKLPWHGARRFDRRLQLFDPPAREMVTNSKPQDAGSAVGGNLMVDCYVCWRIPATQTASDQAERVDAKTGDFGTRPVVQFLRTVRTPAGAEALLEKLLLSKLGAEIAQVQLSELLHVQTNPVPEGGPSRLEQIGQVVKTALQSQTVSAGIQIVDVRIKRLNLPSANRSAVYDRQRSERRRIATKYRSEGEAEATKIKSQAQRERDAILAQADAEAQRIRGSGEAKATEIYAAAYGRDPEFYELLRTLQAYEQILGERTTLVLSASSRMFRLLNDGLPSSIPLPKNMPAVEATSTGAAPEHEPRSAREARGPDRTLPAATTKREGGNP